jgi:hypothetical protein
VIVATGKCRVGGAGVQLRRFRPYNGRRSSGELGEMCALADLVDDPYWQQNQVYPGIPHCAIMKPTKHLLGLAPAGCLAAPDNGP